MQLPRYPIYVVSKGRWQEDRRLTNRWLEKVGVPHFVVVEAQEREAYAAVVNPEITTLLTLDPAYQRDYDACMTLAEGDSRGSGPARNFAWDHALTNGHARYWCVDDNISMFMRFYRNIKTPSSSPAVIRAMEDFADRYTNVAMAGPQYFMFVSRKDGGLPPFIKNTRIYSCNLIDTSVPFRWRGRYNEDTILSLDMLKAGWCTVQFNAFLQWKTPTQQMKGGNTDEIYKAGTLEKSQMLVREHPDVAKLAWKFGRWHHHVDYRPFKKNRLKRKPDIVIPEGPNEYGMKLVHIDTSRAKGGDSCTIS